MLTRTRLDAILEQLPRLRIGLVGDLFLDRYLELAPGVVEMSIETGLEAYQIPTIRNSPGAMGTVLNNLAALGVGELVPVSVLGDDGQAYDLRQQLRKLPVDDQHLLTDPQRLTPTYTKPLRLEASGHWVELNRLDLRTRGPLREETLISLCDHLRQVFAATDGLIVLDQINEHNWGVIHDRVRETLEELQRSVPDKLIFVDSRRHLGRFNCGVLKGNRSEVLAAAQATTDDSAAVQAAARQLTARTGKVSFCTLGEEGILVTAPPQNQSIVPGFAVSGPIDIVGAGDAATSGMVTSLLAGANPSEAARMGNLVASITIQQLGTTGTASPAQLRQGLVS